MATLPDAKVIDRESNIKSLADRYNDSQKAGGTFDAYAATTNTMIQGAVAPYGYTQKSRTSTIEPGFTTKIANVVGGNGLPGENFNEKALNYSDTINGGVKKTGVDKISTNWNGQSSVSDALYTVDPGFKLRAIPQQTQLKDAVGTDSKQLSLYMKGFNNKKYMDGSFSR